MSAPAHGFGDPCLPTRAAAVPSGPQWLHEIKHDGYRLMVRRTPQSVRIKTRNGFDWTDRYPQIIAAAERLRASSFVLDGEGVILRPDGVSDFDRLRTPGGTTARCSCLASTPLPRRFLRRGYSPALRKTAGDPPAISPSTSIPKLVR